MNAFWFAPLLVTLHSVCGIVFRYAPFGSLVSRGTLKKMLVCYGAGLAAEFCLLCLSARPLSAIPHLFYIVNINAWFIIYFIINCVFIRRRFFQHMFVLGIQMQLTYFVHTLSILTLVWLSSEGIFPPFDRADWDSMELLLYFLYFIVLSCAVWCSQKRLVPLFLSSIDGIRWDILGVVPLLISYVTMISTLSVSHFTVSPRVFFVRFIAAVAVFLIWRYVVCAMRRYTETIELERENFMLRARSASIAEQARLIKNHDEKLRCIRHDMRHNIRIMTSLLQGGHTDALMELLGSAEKDTLGPEPVFFCENELVNSALTVYIMKARDSGVPVECSADIPRDMNIDSTDLAMLAANMLENALNASLRQPSDRRGIKISARCDGRCFVFAISNIFEGNVEFGDDGLPVSHAEGHGMGIRSAKNIAAKNNGTLLCTFEGGLFTIRAIFSLAEKERTE